MKTLITSLMMCTVAFAFLAQPAYADNYDRWDRHHHNHGNGHGKGHWKHKHHQEHAYYPYVVYQPAQVYYYEPPRIVHYPQPIYAPPIFSFNWVSR
jgi:hypothetical protein